MPRPLPRRQPRPLPASLPAACPASAVAAVAFAAAVVAVASATAAVASAACPAWAAVVAAYLDDRIKIDPTRIQSVGYSSARPIVPNDTETHRLLNRRVDLVILSVHNVR